jgi:phosphoribosylformimino-5-aminoimidazole carboxamide ribotide isomerase
VRLYQGNYNEETVFSDDPLDVALQWQSMGAPRLHIVDLDGAASGEIRNLPIIREIVMALLIPTELGGGIRDMKTIESLLKIGVERVILGSAVIDDRQFTVDACRHFGDSVIIGIDAREGYAATHGWLDDTDMPAVELARTMVDSGAKRLIYTDINRDGTLTEPNFSAISEMVEAARVPVIAAGGIASVNHLKMLEKLGVEGAIVGRALYTGDIGLKEAIEELADL